MKEGRNRDLGTEPVGRLIFSLAVPAIAAQIVNMLYNVVDRMYIGRIEGVGADALTGVGLVFPILMIISAFSSLVASGGAPRAAIKMGEQDNDHAEKIMGNCFVSLMGISIAAAFVFFIFSQEMLSLFGGSPETIPFGLQYMRIYLLGTPFICISMGMNSFITTQGFAKTSMMTVLIGAIINIVLDPIFIFVFNMGVRGAAIATIISQCVSAVWVLSFLFGSKSKIKLKKKYFHVEKEVMSPVLALGVSPFIMQSTESLLSVCFIYSLSKYGGKLAVGAITIITSVMQMLNLPVMGFLQGVQPVISYNYGARNTERVKKAFKLALITGFIFTTTFWLAVQIMPSLFARMFTTDLPLMEITVWALRIYLAVGFINAGQSICQQSFVALGQAKVSLFLALLRKIILLIPLIFILPFFFTDKVFAVFLAEPVADFIAATVTMITFFAKFPKILREAETR